MKRRHYLSSVGGSFTAVLPAALQQESESGSLSISITETNDPVQAGDLLKVTVEVENTGDSDLRPELEFLVGGESQQATTSISVRANDTNSTQFQYRTFPVLQDVVFPVAVESSESSDEKTVEVNGINELDEGYVEPSNTVIVQPGTLVLFEVDESVLDEYGNTHWFAGEDYQGQSDGPWPAQYREVREKDYWLPRFEQEGVYQISVLVDNEEENLTARKNITVSSDGNAPPSVEGRNPDQDVLSTGETYDLELEVSSEDSELDRVVWWMHQSDRILGVSNIEGNEDTAPLTAVGGCHTCPVIAWVIDENNAVTEVSPWVFEDPVDEDRVKEYEEGTLEEFEQELQSQGIDVAYLELVTTGMEGLDRQIYFDYHTSASSEDELYDEIAVIAYEYASLIAAGYDAAMLNAIFMDQYGIDLGGFHIYTDWVEEYVDGTISGDEYFQRVLGEVGFENQ